LKASVLLLLPGHRPSAIAAAAELLRAGQLVALPTETVYGLGADATDERAVARIFAAKGRPRFNPLIVHVAAAADAAALVDWPEPAARLAARFWPGPLTLVLPRRPDCPVAQLASAGGATLAVRVPDHPIARTLLRAAARPVAAPSANRAGRISPTTAAAVVEELGDAVALILDGGPCRVGLESTVLDLTGAPPRLLRPGGIAREALEAALGAPLAAGGPPAAGPLRAPGQLLSHYAPRHPVRLDATTVVPDEALLAFGPAPPAGAAATCNLSPAGDLVEAAANLFAMLRALDRLEVARIAAMPVPAEGLGLAIRDRLMRAAAPR
jgi:L-threonylcarbamoyladenylate synthase